MIRIFAACPRYIQGPGALDRLAETTSQLGARCAIVVDAHVLSLIGDRVEAQYSDGAARIIAFSGEITLDTVEVLTAVARRHGASVVVAMGGGKALDAGKAVARRLDLPVVTVPTIASTDAPASRGIAIYDDSHRLALVEQLTTNPAAVLVDTAIIAAAPGHFLKAGIGDAIAKKFEAEATLAGGGLNKHGTRPLQAGLIAADGCYRVLRAHGEGAVKAAERGETDEHFEAAVEACFLLSALGFENTGLSIAHSVTRGLVKARQVKHVPHGYHVAYGLMVQFATEDRDDAAIEDLRGFLRRVGLPTTLSELGMTDVVQSDINEIARLTMTSPHIGNLGSKVTIEVVQSAISRIERSG